MEIALALVVLALLAWFVSAPLRRPPAEEAVEDPRLADLEARKEAKYREIRDAEADRAAGKLSEEDFARIDAELRAEALEILDGIERARPGGAGH